MLGWDGQIVRGPEFIGVIAARGFLVSEGSRRVGLQGWSHLDKDGTGLEGSGVGMMYSRTDMCTEYLQFWAQFWALRMIRYGPRGT